MVKASVAEADNFHEETNIHEASKIPDADSGDSEDSDARSIAASGIERCDGYYLADMSNWHPTSRFLNSWSREPYINE